MSNFPARARHYAFWTARLLSPLVALGWIAVAADRRVTLRDRSILVTWFAAFFLFYSFYGPYEAWWYTRFLLPGYPALILGALLATRDFVIGFGPRVRRWRVAAAAVLVVLALAVEVSFLAKERPHKIYKGERTYPEACAMARRLPPNAIILSMQMSGALHYYTDLTYAMWNWMDAERFAVLRVSTESRGFRWYALLADFEVAEVKNTSGSGRDRPGRKCQPERDSDFRAPMKLRKSGSITPASVRRCSEEQSRAMTISSQASPGRKLVTIPKRRGFRSPPP